MIATLDRPQLSVPKLGRRSTRRVGVAIALLGVCALSTACTTSPATSTPAGHPPTSTTTTIDDPTSSEATTAPTISAPGPTTTLPTVRTAPLDLHTWNVDRDDVATTSLAPITLLASSGTVTVAFSTRESGFRPDTATSVSADGHTWHEVASPWRDDPPPEDPNDLRVRTPVALVYASERFVALGYRGELVGSRYRAHTIVATSVDGTRWDLDDVDDVPVGDNVTLLTHHAGEWFLVADGADGGPSRLYRSPDAITWRADTSFEFRVGSLTSTPFGLVATGTRGVSGNETSVVSVAPDGRTWHEPTGWQPYSSSAIGGVLRTPGGITIVGTELYSTVPRSAWQTRLVHTDDGSTWTTTPTPQCLMVFSGINGVVGTADAMAIVTAREPPEIAISRTGGATWSCTALDDPSFAPDVADNGRATINGIADIAGSLTLFGGRAAVPGAKPNWNGAVWSIVDAITSPTAAPPTTVSTPYKKGAPCSADVLAALLTAAHRWAVGHAAPGLVITVPFAQCADEFAYGSMQCAYVDHPTWGCQQTAAIFHATADVWTLIREGEVDCATEPDPMIRSGCDAVGRTH